MNSFSTGKLKEITSLMQLIVKALIGIDEETGELKEKQLYGILQSISSETDEERTGNIDGTLQEQVKALNDNIKNLNTTLESIETLVSSIVGNAYDVGYVRTMNASTNW